MVFYYIQIMKHIKLFEDVDINDDFWEEDIQMTYDGKTCKLYLDNKKIGYAFLSNVGNFGKIWRFKEVFEKYNLDIDIENGLELGYMKIDPEYRKMGYGEYFLKEIIKLSIEENKKFIILESSDKDTETKTLIKFYTKAGFKYYPTDNGDYMIKDLNHPKIFEDIEINDDFWEDEDIKDDRPQYIYTVAIGRDYDIIGYILAPDRETAKQKALDMKLTKPDMAIFLRADRINLNNRTEEEGYSIKLKKTEKVVREATKIHNSLLSAYEKWKKL